jgi:CheY-like chemotaxis protein
VTSQARPRVFIVDDHGLFRSGVRSELGDEVEVVGEAEDVAHSIDRIAATLPDVVLLDVHLPGGGGQAVVTAMRQSHPQVRFLALSASDAPEDVIAVIRAGARGYVTKTISGAMRSSPRGWPVSSSTRSPPQRHPGSRPPPSTPSWTSSPCGSGRCCG